MSCARVVAEVLQGFQHGVGGGQKVQAPSAPVGWMRTPFQHSGSFKPIDDTTDRDRFYFHKIGQRALGDTLLAIQDRQHLPLGAGHAGAAAIHLETFLQRPGHLDQQEPNGRLVVLHGFTYNYI